MFILRLYNTLKKKKVEIKEITHKLNMLYKFIKQETEAPRILNQVLHSNAQLKWSGLIITITEWGSRDKMSSLPRYFSQKVSKSFLLHFIYERSPDYTFKQPVIKVGKTDPHLAQQNWYRWFSGTACYYSTMSE